MSSNTSFTRGSVSAQATCSNETTAPTEAAVIVVRVDVTAQAASNATFD